MPVGVNSDASVDVSGAVGISAHMSDTMNSGCLFFLVMSSIAVTLETASSGTTESRAGGLS